MESISTNLIIGSSRASSTKTRIETRHYDGIEFFFCIHQEQVPRKQGLKLFVLGPIGLTVSASRASSTKTRIETTKMLKQSGCALASRASSTKTRIETMDVSFLAKRHQTHQEQVPRKQGLKLAIGFGILPGQTEHQEQVPRKQGLKRDYEELVSSSFRASRASSTKTRIETRKR